MGILDGTCQEVGAPRLSSNNGTNQPEQRGNTRVSLEDGWLPLQNTPMPRSKSWDQNLLCSDEQFENRLVATNANSRVQRNPKSWLTKSCGEKVSWKDGIVPSPQTPVRGYYQNQKHYEQYENRLLRAGLHGSDADLVYSSVLCPWALQLMQILQFSAILNQDAAARIRRVPILRKTCSTIVREVQRNVASRPKNSTRP